MTHQNNTCIKVHNRTKISTTLLKIDQIAGHSNLMISGYGMS